MHAIFFLTLKHIQDVILNMVASKLFLHGVSPVCRAYDDSVLKSECSHIDGHIRFAFFQCFISANEFISSKQLKEEMRFLANIYISILKLILRTSISYWNSGWVEHRVEWTNGTIKVQKGGNPHITSQSSGWKHCSSSLPAYFSNYSYISASTY